jgi:TP901 family phage tail tape measure protein
MADVNANIGVNIDTSAALAQLKSLQRQISQFHTSISKSSESAAIAQKSLQKNLLSSINSIGAFSAELRTVKTSAESFTSSLEGNKFSMREYFRYAGASTKTFGRLFKSEFDTIGKVAEERVKTLQTQYIKMGRNASGAMEAIAIRPTSLNMQDYGTRTAMAAQKQALFNQLMKQGSTNLLNFGKNTQWAGRQLMVGFTIPLTIVGSAATKTFMDMEAQALKFKKVYGDLFTPQEETQQALDNITELGKSFTKYGIAVSQTVGLAAEAAAAGFQGLDLQRQTTEATRLSVLGQIDSQKALETTIALQNAFGMSSENLAGSIDFLNAVENQTVVSLDDITTAIPKVAPVIQQLGGDVKDLTFFITAMKEGGINASEGANALKSGLAALINPTGRASEMLAKFGINAQEIVTSNKGDLKATVIEFATALNQLDPLNRAQAIEQMFGKFQFARLSSLFANVTKEGNQASRVLDLANSSVEELASLSEKELGMTAESSMNKFKKTIEDLKVALIPVGQAFLEAVTPILEFVANILEKFGNLSGGTKKVVTLITLGIAGLAPVFLMTFGLLANLLANAVKGAMILRNGYLRLTGQSQILGDQTQYLTMEQLDATAAAHSLDQSHAKLTQQFTTEASAVAKLIAAYQQATAAGQKFMLNNPGMMSSRKGYANGVISVPGSGKGDTVPAMLTPGEAVIPAAMAKKYAPLINGMIAGNIPGYKKGRKGRDASSGELAQRNVSGGYDLSHIGGITKKRGDELVALAEKESQGVRQYVKSLIESSSSGINTIFDVLDNRITVQSKELNAAVGETGSGKKAPISLFKRDAVDRSGAFNAPLLTKMDEAGATTEELKDAVSQVTKEIEDGLKKLEGQTTITAEEIDNLVKRAYENVGKTNEKVKSAYEKMQDPGALKETAKVSGSRGRKSLKGGYNLPSQKSKVSAMVQRMSPGTYPSQQAFVFTGDEARKVGVANAEELALLYDKLDAQAKQRVQKFLGNIKAMSEQVIVEAKAAGIKIGESVPVGISMGAKTASPSKETIKTGEDIGKGLEIGMQSRKDEVAAVGADLGKTATQSTQRGASTGVITPGQPYNIQKIKGGIPTSEVVRGISADPIITKKVIEQSRAMETATNRLRGLDRNIMGASFAISSLSGIASMSGGKLGAMSGTIAKVTGAMFALQAITGLLTQTKLLELAQTRISIASNAMRAVDIKAGGKVTGLLPVLKKFGFGLTRLLGPIGIGIGVITAGVSIIKLVNAARERERKTLEAFGDAVRNSTDQIKSLGDYFGVVPTQTGLETTKPQLVVDKDTRAELDKFKSSNTFKEFAGTIEAVSKLSNKDATLALQAKGQELLGKGFTKDQVSTILRAIQEEAGKTNLKINFAKIDVNELNNTLQSEMAKKFAELPKFINDNLEKKTFRVNGILVDMLVPGKEIEAELKNSGTLLKTYLNGVTGMFQNGQISGKKFNELFGKALTDVTSKLPQTRDQILLLNAAIDQMDSPLAKAAKGIDNLKTKTLLLQAAALNATVSVAALRALERAAANPKDVDDQIRAGVIQGDIAQMILTLTKAQQKANNVLRDSFKDLNTAEKEKAETELDRLNKAQDHIALQEQLIDMQNAPKLKKYNDELERQNQLLEDINKEIEATTEAKIDPLENKLKANGYLIDQIAIKEDEINERYNLQIESLSKVKQINEDILSSDKERLSLADALSSGDISAAASVAQEARARTSASALGRAESALTKSRDSEIEALGRNKIEKENKQIQLDIAKIQREQIEPLNDQKIAIEKNITAQNELKSALEKSIDIRKSEIKYLGMTKTQIDEAARALDLAQNPNVDIKSDSFITKVIKGALGDANALKASLKEVAALSKTAFNDPISKNIKKTAKSVTPDLSDYQDAFLFRGSGMGFAKGGLVPKYFAAGGLSKGTDTVPAMLTPGEFVMNKSSVDKYGPLLSAINSPSFKMPKSESYSAGSSSINSVVDNSSAMYNYNIGITVPQSNANSGDIANAVISQIKYIDAQRIRGQK